MFVAMSDIPQKPRSRSLTPLMTPDETSPEPSIPSSPDLEFPLRSEEDVDLDDLLLQVEKQMQEEDRILSDEFHNASPTRATRLFREAQNSPNMKFEEERQFEPICRTFGHQRQPRRDLEKIKLEVPMPSSPLSVEKTIRANPIEPGSFRSSESELLPELHDSSSELKSSDSNQKKGQELFDLYVDMNDINVSIEENRLSAIAIDHEAAHLGPELSQDPNDELEQPAEEAAAHVIRDFQQVEIIDPAACLKLAVPELDSVPFTPLWEDSRNETLTRSLDSGCLTLPDPLDVKRESDFNWAPFPSGFMELHMTEEVEDCGRFQDITMTPQGILRSDQMLWKQPGLRVLDTEDESDNELDEDDELILAMSMPSLPLVPRKRLDHDFDEALSLEVRKASELFSRNASNKLTSSKTLEKFKNGFSASQALETFLDLRGSKFKNITIPPSTDELLEDPIQATQFDAKSGSETQITEDHIPKTVAIDQETRDPVTTQVPLTPLHNPLNDGGHVLQSTSTLRWPRTVVIETAMLQRNRSIVDFLETKVGDRFSLLYRDMSNCELQGQDRYSTAPDIILNPRTGLMFTSFQALNQKRLPGQGQAADQGLVHSKIHQLADNYAQLIVLVTSPSVSASLSQTQVDSISSFTAFCCRLSDQAAVHVNPIWVSASSEFPTMEAAVNKYTWDLIDQHAFPKSPPSKESLWRVPLIHEETVWESFLRKVGLNPMSAQIVLGMLKRPDPSRGSRDSWGLRKFVQMSHDQRASIFGELLGVKLLDRVNEVLEKRSS